MSRMPTLGSDGSGTPVWISPDDRDALAGQVEDRRDGDPADEGDEGARDPRGDAAEDDDQDQGADADDERPDVDGRPVSGQVRQALEDPARRRRDPEERGHLPDDDRDRQADDEAGHHRLGQELRHEAELRDPRGEQEQADHQGEHRAELEVAGVAGDRQRADDRGRHHRDRGARRDLQVPGRAEDRVRGHRGERGDQAGLRRQAGEPRVGHRDRDHDAPADDAGDEVGPQVPAVVGRDPAEDRDVAHQPWWKVGQDRPRCGERPLGSRARMARWPGRTMLAIAT